MFIVVGFAQTGKRLLGFGYVLGSVCTNSVS